MITGRSAPPVCRAQPPSAACLLRSSSVRRCTPEPAAGCGFGAAWASNRWPIRLAATDRRCGAWRLMPKMMSTLASPRSASMINRACPAGSQGSQVGRDVGLAHPALAAGDCDDPQGLARGTTAAGVRLCEQQCAGEGCRPGPWLISLAQRRSTSIGEVAGCKNRRHPLTIFTQKLDS